MRVRNWRTGGGVAPYVNEVFGFDFIQSKIDTLNSNHPQINAWTQSFLEEYKIPENVNINKIYSYTVMQYCNPKDIEIFIKNQLEVVKSGTIANLDITDKDKAWVLYKKDIRNLTKEDFDAVKDNLCFAFEDGSYWHDIDDIIRIYKSYGIKSIKVIPGVSDYRSSVIVEK